MPYIYVYPWSWRFRILHVRVLDSGFLTVSGSLSRCMHPVLGAFDIRRFLGHEVLLFHCRWRFSKCARLNA
jgi:hypothetical protein